MRIQPQHFADMQTFPALRRPMTRFPIRSETPMPGLANHRGNVSLICRRSPLPDVRWHSSRYGVKPNGWQMQCFADMQTFPAALRRSSLRVRIVLHRWYVPIRQHFTLCPCNEAVGTDGSVHIWHSAHLICKQDPECRKNEIAPGSDLAKTQAYIT